MKRMADTDCVERRRLVLQIERGLQAQVHLRTLLAVSETTVAGLREDLQTVEARLKRPRRVKVHSVLVSRRLSWARASVERSADIDAG
jgi:hypothetical protein